MSAAARRGLPWAWIVLGLALGVAGAFLLLREPSDALTPEGLEAARERWQSRRPSDYRMEVETGGAMPAVHRVRVAAGEVVEMTTGGAEAARSAWEYWSVDGLFGFLETELANARSPQRAYGVEPGRVVLRVRFDPQWGYPEFFLRHVMGSRQSVEWKISGFAAEGAASGPQ